VCVRITRVEHWDLCVPGRSPTTYAISSLSLNRVSSFMPRLALN
jgi:hypothetical protein